jgi:hypothetical protein
LLEFDHSYTLYQISCNFFLLFSVSLYDYGFRIYNPGIGKFLSVDPLTKSYPWYTPYQFAGNKPIWAVDLDGLEEKYSTMQMENELALTVANTVALA